MLFCITNADEKNRSNEINKYTHTYAYLHIYVCVYSARKIVLIFFNTNMISVLGMH